MSKKNKDKKKYVLEDDFPFPKYAVGCDIDNLLSFENEEKAIEDGKNETVADDMPYGVYKLVKIIYPPVPTEPTVEDVE